MWTTNGTMPGDYEEDDEPVTRRIVEEEDDEPLPETLRSSVLARALEPVSRPIIVDEVAPSKDAYRAA